MPSPLKNIRRHVEPMWSLWDCEQWINLLGWLAAFQLIDTCNNTEIPLKPLNLTRESSHRPLRMQRSSSWSLLHVFISTDARKPRTGTVRAIVKTNCLPLIVLYGRFASSRNPLGPLQGSSNELAFALALCQHVCHHWLLTPGMALSQAWQVMLLLTPVRNATKVISTNQVASHSGVYGLSSRP